MAHLTIEKLNNIIFDNLDENGDEYKIFIESGTFLGETTIKLQPYFNTLYTVELSEKYFNMFNSIKNSRNLNNIFNYQGETSDILPDIFKLFNDKNKCIFWLDGHFSSGDTGKGNKDCPLIEECQIIDQLYPSDEMIILIDDVWLFKTYIKEDWSDINIESIKKCFTNFEISKEVILYHETVLDQKDILAFKLNRKL